MGGALLYGARARIGLMAVLPEMQSVVGPMGAGIPIPESPPSGGSPNFSRLVVKISYELYRVSESKVIARGSAHSQGLIKGGNVVNDDKAFDDVMNQVMNKAAQRIMADVKKAALKSTSK